MNMTIGGCSETEADDWQVIPTGSPSETEVTTVTPEQKRASVSRNCRAAAATSGSSEANAASPGQSPSSSDPGPKEPRKESISSRGGHCAAASGFIPSGISEAVSLTAMRSVSTEDVSPVRHRRRLARHPALLVDLQTLTTEFDVETRRRLHIE